MRKIAFVFPGQARMEPGAGCELVRTQPLVEQFVVRAGEIVERDLLKLCLEGTEEALNDTAIVHTLLYAISCGTAAALEKESVHANISTGYSLGAFASAHASGMFSFEDGARLVEERAGLIALHSKQSGGGAMCLVYTDAATVTRVCKPLSEVSISALNSPQVTSISGPEEDVRAAVGLFKTAGVRTRQFPVMVISHHPSLTGMADRFAQTLRKVRFTDISRPMVSDATGTAIRRFPSVLRNILRKQLTGPVDWVKVVATLETERVENGG